MAVSGFGGGVRRSRNRSVKSRYALAYMSVSGRGAVELLLDEPLGERIVDVERCHGGQDELAFVEPQSGVGHLAGEHLPVRPTVDAGLAVVRFCGGESVGNCREVTSALRTTRHLTERLQAAAQEGCAQAMIRWTAFDDYRARRADDPQDASRKHLPVVGDAVEQRARVPFGRL